MGGHVNIVHVLPVFSQLKALWLICHGKKAEARQTQEEFSKGCVIVSQLRSLTEVILGDAEAARKTQEYQGQVLQHVAEATPAVGHAMAGVYCLAGDWEGAARAANHATKTLVVVSSGIAASIACPVAGPPAALAASVAYDGATSAAKGKPDGMIAAIERVAKGKSNPGELFDLGFQVGLAATGTATAEMAHVHSECVFEQVVRQEGGGLVAPSADQPQHEVPQASRDTEEEGKDELLVKVATEVAKKVLTNPTYEDSVRGGARPHHA